MISMEEWTPRGDPILALLPADRPWAFDLLPFEEQKWRARVFLAIWINTGSAIFAWAQALRNDDTTAETKAWTLANMTDAVILDGLASRQQPEVKPLARAMLLFERQADASWLPTTVILATPVRLQGRCLPGDLNREARLASTVTNALPPRPNDSTEARGDYEDWVDWALDAFANGHTSWATEVKPEITVEELFQREVSPRTNGAFRLDPAVRR